MQKKKQEITSTSEMEDIIRFARVCRIGMTDTGKPYIVPVNFGYENGVIYVHSAKKGRKIDILKINNTVCLEFEHDVSIVESEKPCDWTVHYESVIAWGKAYLLDDDDIEQKQYALNRIMQHYAGREFEFAEKDLRRTTVIKIEIEEMTGKRSPGE